MNLRRIFIFTLSIVGITGLAWLVIPTPAPVRPAPLAETPWKIPVLPVFNTKNALVTLTSGSLWGNLADSVKPNDMEPGWRFLGAMVRGQARYVIIQKDNQPEQTLIPGDNLPGGSKILSIESDRLCLLINGQKRNLYIYPQGRLSGKMSYLADEGQIRTMSRSADSVVQ